MPGHSMSMSSYPATIVSLDDFLTISSGLITVLILFDPDRFSEQVGRALKNSGFTKNPVLTEGLRLLVSYFFIFRLLPSYLLCEISFL